MLARSDMSGKDAASMLGVPSSAVVCNWARVAKGSQPAVAYGVNSMRDSGNRAYDGLGRPENELFRHGDWSGVTIRILPHA